jgi:hypothetical protein
MPPEHFHPVVLGHGSDQQVARREFELSAGTLVPHSSGELPYQLEMIAETGGHRALSVKLHRNGWHLKLGYRVPSDPPGDDGAIQQRVAQFNLEIGEGRVGLFNDRVDRCQVTLLNNLTEAKNRTELLVMRCLADRDDELSLSPWCTPGENIVSGLDSRKVELAGIDARRQLSRLRKLRCLMHDHAMVTTSLAGEERIKLENARVRRASEGRRRKRMRAPTEELTTWPKRCEGCVDGNIIIAWKSQVFLRPMQICLASNMEGLDVGVG